MFRLVVACAGIALLCAAAYFVSSPLVAGYLPGLDMRSFFAAIALVSSLVAVAVALQTARHTAKLNDSLHILARSLDIALRQVVARTGEETATLGDMTTSVSREVERLSERVRTRDDAGLLPAGSDNVVEHPSMRRGRGQPQNQATAAPLEASAEAAYLKAIHVGSFDLSLQPIVSVDKSTAAGFEVFASLPTEGGQTVDIRRPAEHAARDNAAAFERILFTVAMQAGRKRLGSASTSMPLHIAVSEALLSDGKEFAIVLEMLQVYPDLARSFILSFPVETLLAQRHHQALELLAAKGARFAAEGWSELEPSAELTGPGTVVPAGLAFVKVPTDRLLDRERTRRKLIPAVSLIERVAAGNLTIVATGVASDEDAVSLIDLGVDLMSGPRFGGPKRLKPENGRPSRLALI